MTEGTKALKQYYAMDLETNITYSFRLDPDTGECLAAEPLETTLEDRNGYPRQFKDAPSPLPLPFGKTLIAVELKTGTKQDYSPLVKVFTMVWPSAEDWKTKGDRPAVTFKELPRDLIKAGIAPPPKGPVSPTTNVDDTLTASLKNIDKMIGLASAKRDIRQNIAVARFNDLKKELGLESQPISRHMVFTGNPGTGKTTFAREVAKVYKALGFIKKDTVYEVKREDLVAGYIGQTAIKTKDAINKADGGILFIDEAYALSRSGDDGDGKDFGQEAIDTLVAEMENRRGSLVVIVAGYPEQMKKFIEANPGLKDRFMTYIDFQDYSVMELGQILDVMIKDRGYTLDADARAWAMDMLEKEKARVNPKDFGNGRVVRNLVEKADKELALRLENAGVLANGHGGLSTDQLKKAVTTLTLDDLKKVSLDNITSVEPPKAGIDFGVSAIKKKQDEAAGKKPANDTGPATPVAEAAPKKSAKASFTP